MRKEAEEEQCRSTSKSPLIWSGIVSYSWS